MLFCVSKIKLWLKINYNTAVTCYENLIPISFNGHQLFCKIYFLWPFDIWYFIILNTAQRKQAANLRVPKNCWFEEKKQNYRVSQNKIGFCFLGSQNFGGKINYFLISATPEQQIMFRIRFIIDINIKNWIQLLFMFRFNKKG